MEHKRILLITSFDMQKIGGAVTHIQQQITALKERGHHVRLLSGDQIRLNAMIRFRCFARASFKRDRYRVRILQYVEQKIIRKIEEVQRAERFDLIHCHDVYAAHAALKSNVPLCLTVHGPASKEALMAGAAPVGSAFLDYIRMLEKECYIKSERLIAVDSGQAEIIREICGRSDVAILQNCVDEKKLTQERLLPFRLPELFFLVPRRLVAKNGVAVAIKAFQELRNPAAYLVIAGGGPLRKSLNELADGNRQIIFLGDVEHDFLPQMMRMARAVIIPSVPANGVVEATSIAALEAMGVGAVTIASDIGGLSEMIRHDQTGLLFPAGDWKRLTGYLRNVLEDPMDAARIGRTATAYIAENYSLQRWVKGLLGVYETIGSAKE